MLHVIVTDTDASPSIISCEHEPDAVTQPMPSIGETTERFSDGAKEILMRVLALAIIAFGTALAASQTSAQTYAPGYPVCLHVFGPVSYFDCRYTSIAQCNISASGRPADCVVNPYAANAGAVAPALHHRRYHRRHAH